MAKAPSRNPFGEDEEPAQFNDFDVFTKIKVLQQLSTWTLGNVDRIRGMMSQEEDQLGWRMEPLGWDKLDRAYFVLDDNRLYRRSDEPPPPPSPKQKPKAKTKSKVSKNAKSKGTRASKRRKIEESEDEEMDDAQTNEGAQDDTVMMNGGLPESDAEAGYGFTSKTWECIAITLDEYQDFLATIFRTRDANEKQLRKRIEEDVVPIIEKRAEALRQKQLKKLREIENLQKLATAKRSSRIAGRAEKEKQERDEREAEEKKLQDLKMAHEEQERQKRIEEGHESRRLTREQRLKEREVKRILHEEELAKIEEQATRASSHDPTSDAVTDNVKRMSERQLKTQKEQHKKELQKLAEEEDKWYFDCAVCGMNGENLDDGSHSIACERCSVWQHSKCHGFSPKQAEKDGFHFVCATCKRREEDAKKPKIPSLKLGKNRASASPDVQRSTSRPTTANGQKTPGLADHVARQLDAVQPPQAHHRSAGPFGPLTNGPSLSPSGQAPGPPGYHYPPIGNFAPRPPPSPQQTWQGNPFPTPGRAPLVGYSSSPPHPPTNGYGVSIHQNQHQYMHQNAVVSSGGHTLYPNQQYQSSPPQWGQGTPSGWDQQSPPPQQQHYYRQPQYTYHQPSPHHQLPPHQQPPRPPTHPNLQTNMLHSPDKGTASLSRSPPQAQQQPHAPSHPSQTQHVLATSPKAALSPPRNTYAQYTAQSPVKSSPPLHQAQQSQHQNVPPIQPHFAQTPSTFHPPTINGASQDQQTPQQVHPSPASSNANGIAADGMSGPWPESTKVIPQKHDQSPAAIPTEAIVSQAKVLPPVAPLVPSPRQHTQHIGPQSVPTKKMPDVNEDGVNSSSQVKGAAPSPPVARTPTNGSASGQPSQ